MRCFLILLFLAGCTAAPATYNLDPRTTLLTADAVEHPVHQTGDQRLLPSGAELFGVVTRDAILRKAAVDEPGRRDNLTHLLEGEEVWLLEQVDDAWLLHAMDGYIGYADRNAIEVIDAETFTTRLRNHTSDAAQACVADAIAHAEARLGTPYLWGGRSDAGIDCSGLTQTAYASVGVMLPRDSDMQAEVGRLVATRWHQDGLIPGDLLFFLHPERGRIHHVALHIGDGRYIEAAGPGVQYGSLNPDHDDFDAGRAATFAWARRVTE